MDIPQLEAFLWISRLGSITAASKRLHLTQSTLSMRIKALETSLGLQLFNRSSRSISLTPKGRDLVAYAETILTTARQIQSYVEDPLFETATVRVGISELIALTFGPQLVHRFSKLYPNVVLDLDIGAPRPMLGALENGELDVVLVPAVSRPHAASFVSVALGSVTFSWMASPALGLRDATVTPRELERLPIIGTASNESIFYSLIEQWFADDHAQIRRYSACNSLATYGSMVIAGLGISLLPNSYFAAHVAGGKLQVLTTDRSFNFDYYAVCRAGEDSSMPKQLLDCAQSASTFS